MNRILFSVCLLGLLGSSFSAYSQTSSAPGATSTPALVEAQRYVGFRVGYSHYRMRGSQADFRTSAYLRQHTSGYVSHRDANRPVEWVTAGLVVRQRLYRSLSVETGLSYVRQGGRFENAPGGGFTQNNTDYRIDNLQLPLLLNLPTVRLSPAVRLYVEGGLAGNAVVKGVQLDTVNYHPTNTFRTPRWLLATVYGAGLVWQQERTQYLLSLRCTNDITDFFQRHYAGTPYRLRSAGFTVTTGLLVGQ